MMNDPPEHETDTDKPQPEEANMQGSKTNGGGFFIAAGILGGAIIGGLFGQPSAGLIVGLLTGVAAAFAIYLLDRR